MPSPGGDGLVAQYFAHCVREGDGQGVRLGPVSRQDLRKTRPVFPLLLGKKKGRSIAGAPPNPKLIFGFWCKYCCSIARKLLILLAFGVNPISPLAPYRDDDFDTMVSRLSSLLLCQKLIQIRDFHTLLRKAPPLAGVFPVQRWRFFTFRGL